MIILEQTINRVMNLYNRVNVTIAVTLSITGVATYEAITLYACLVNTLSMTRLYSCFNHFILFLHCLNVLRNPRTAISSEIRSQRLLFLGIPSSCPCISKFAQISIIAAPSSFVQLVFHVLPLDTSAAEAILSSNEHGMN